MVCIRNSFIIFLLAENWMYKKKSQFSSNLGITLVECDSYRKECIQWKVRSLLHHRQFVISGMKSWSDISATILKLMFVFFNGLVSSFLSVFLLKIIIWLNNYESVKGEKNDQEVEKFNRNYYLSHRLSQLEERMVLISHLLLLEFCAYC